MAVRKKFSKFFAPLNLLYLWFFLVGAAKMPANQDKDLITPRMKKEYVGISYFNQIFGQVHSTRSPYSPGLTTISCGHPLKLFQQKDSTPDAWEIVQTGGYDGFVMKKFITTERPKDCFQQKYQNFFNALDLDLTNLYFWGRLYDQYIMIKTEIP